MDNITTLKRPKPGDDEEELFRMQEEFLKNKLQPSAKVINLRDQAKSPANPVQPSTSSNNANPTKKQSRFSELKKLKTCQGKVSTSGSTGEVCFMLMLPLGVCMDFRFPQGCQLQKKVYP
ncbi:hypothetical protein KPH14_012356 [Odynerus spinipes]|uniref:Uncharacterized protein n=1 Tax=Odynerus spinipes TaxID=1348599 RepID=A0AAD9RIX4_9HYME|nr:hypothetical protein KPH14_012356 [Odynerus spinipes]